MVTLKEGAMGQQILINDYQEIQFYKNKILANTEATVKKISNILSTTDSVDAMKMVKFTKCGLDPLFEVEQNFIEQTNQTFTYLVSLDAVQILMDRHGEAKFIVNLGAQNGFDIVSHDNSIICECFANVTPDNNRKLELDVKRVSQYEDAKYRYVIFYSEEDKSTYVNRIKNTYPNVTIIKLKDI